MSVDVLFVDDEPDVLEGIENRLYALRSPWRIRLAESGPEALRMMAASPPDIVVSDMRMPGMDGADLLQAVKLRFPRVVRIILSGETGARGFIRAAACAHQVLSKPCDLQELQRLVDEGLVLQRRLHDDRVIEAINDLGALPSLPEISSRLEGALLDESTFVHDVADILEEDAAIVARILHVANSPFFRGSGEVTDVKTAITRLGFDLIRGLVLSEELYTRIERSAAPHAELLRCHREALRMAYIASAIGGPEQDRRMLFTAAVLYGVARLQRLTAPELEQTELSDSELAGYLLSLWGLPFRLVQAVAFTDDPSTLACTLEHPAVTLHLARAIRARLDDPSNAPWSEQPLLAPWLLESGLVDEAYLDSLVETAAHWKS